MTVLVYATPAQYFDFIGASQPPGDPDKVLLAELRRASEQVRSHLRTARYSTDDAGLPTDTLVCEALRDATCAYVAYWGDTGDITGAEAIAGPVKIGSVSLGGTSTGGASSRTPADTRVSDEAVTILRNAGLISAAVAHS